MYPKSVKKCRKKRENIKNNVIRMTIFRSQEIVVKYQKKNGKSKKFFCENRKIEKNKKYE